MRSHYPDLWSLLCFNLSCPFLFSHLSNSKAYVFWECIFQYWKLLLPGLFPFPLYVYVKYFLIPISYVSVHQWIFCQLPFSTCIVYIYIYITYNHTHFLYDLCKLVWSWIALEYCWLELNLKNHFFIFWAKGSNTF